MAAKLKDTNLLAVELHTVQERFAKAKAVYSHFVELAKKRLAPEKTSLTIKLNENSQAEIFLEYLDRRAQLGFHFGEGRGHVSVYDVTVPTGPVAPLRDRPKPFFTFSFDGAGRTDLPPLKFSDRPSLLSEDDVLCIVLNIVDLLLSTRRPG